MQDEPETAGVECRRAEAHAGALQTAVDGETVSRAQFECRDCPDRWAHQAPAVMIGSNAALILITLAAALTT
jgi:hypothetical protein